MMMTSFSAILMIIITTVIIIIITVASLQVNAHISSSSITSKWNSACDFSNMTTGGLPSMKLLVDNYAARSEPRAILDRNPLAFSVSLPLDFATAQNNNNDGIYCAGRFMWRGFIAPFWLTQVFNNVGADAESITLPDIASLNTNDLDYFASCVDSVDRITIDPIRISISNLQVIGGSWSFSSPGFNSTTQAADSACNPDNTSSSSSSAASPLSQFIRLFAVTNNGQNVEQIPSSGSSSANSGQQRSYEYVARETGTDCPIYLGVALDPSACPSSGGSITFSGAATVTFSLSLEVTTDPIISASVWYMWAPSTACIFLGIFCLIIYLATFNKNKLPEIASPETADVSVALAFGKVALVSGTVGSAIGLALTLIIDQNQSMLVGTPYSVLLMGSFFFVNALLVIVYAGLLAGKEDKRLKSMPVFIVAWLRLVSRSLAIGATCAAWYRGFFIIGIIYVVFQFFIEIGFWANIATTFSGSHEPLRYGVAGDQMLGLSFVSYLGLFLSPVTGVCASASSRVFCLLEMSERFQVSKQFDAVVDENEGDGEHNNNDLADDDEEELKPRNTNTTKRNQQKKLPTNKKASPKKTKKTKNTKKKNVSADDGNNNTDENDTNTHNDDDENDDPQQQQQEDDNDEIDIEEIRRKIYGDFPVGFHGRLAAGFEGILSIRWWSLVFEVIGLVGLCCVLAHAHPPFVTYCVAQFFASFAYFGAAFGAVSGQCGDGYGSSDKTGLLAVLQGDPRPTIAAISLIPYSSLYTVDEMEKKQLAEDDEKARLLRSGGNIYENEDDDDYDQDGNRVDDDNLDDINVMSERENGGGDAIHRHNPQPKGFHPPPVKNVRNNKTPPPGVVGKNNNNKNQNAPADVQQQQESDQQQNPPTNNNRRVDPYRLTTLNTASNNVSRPSPIIPNPQTNQQQPLASSSSRAIFSPGEIRKELSGNNNNYNNNAPPPLINNEQGRAGNRNNTTTTTSPSLQPFPMPPNNNNSSRQPTSQFLNNLYDESPNRNNNNNNNRNAPNNQRTNSSSNPNSARGLPAGTGLVSTPANNNNPTNNYNNNLGDISARIKALNSMSTVFQGEDEYS